MSEPAQWTIETRQNGGYTQLPADLYVEIRDRERTYRFGGSVRQALTHLRTLLEERDVMNIAREHVEGELERAEAALDEAKARIASLMGRVGQLERENQRLRAEKAKAKKAKKKVTT